MNEKFSTEGIEEVTSILGHSLFALKVKEQQEFLKIAEKFFSENKK